MKTCSKCKQTKALTEFHNCASKKDGKFSACKDCRNAHNREKANEIGYSVLYKRYVDRVGAQVVSEKARDAYEKNKEAAKARSRKWGAENPDKKNKNRREHYLKNKQSYIDSASAWNANNVERRREIARNAARKIRRSKCPEHIAMVTARKMVYRVLNSTGKRKKGRTYEILGYNKQDLMAHIESLFQEGMNWNNHGEWHIDHIIPVSELTRCGVTDPAKINALINLQPLWAENNLKKGAAFVLAPVGTSSITKRSL